MAEAALDARHSDRHAHGHEGAALSQRRLDLLVGAALFVAAAAVGASYVSFVMGAGGKPRFYQEQFGPGVMLACGRGYQNPDVSRVPALRAFLDVSTDRFSCADLPTDVAVKPLHPMQRAFRYQIATVGLTWRLVGLGWRNLAPLYGLFFGTTVAAAYALFRLGMGPIVAACLSLALMISTVHLIYLPHLRDYSKAPFVIALLVGLGWLAKGPVRGPRVIALAAAYGLVLGVGMGFRNDLLIALPPFVVVVLAFMPGSLRDGLGLKAGAILACLGTFAVAMLPMWTIYAPGGGNSMQHVVLLGLVTPFNDTLGVTNGRLYEWGYEFKDEYAHAVVSARATRMHGASSVLDLYGQQYDRTAVEQLTSVARHFPADMIVRVYSAVLRVLELPYTRTSLAPPTWVSDPRLVRAYHVRERVLRALGSIWPGVIVAALAAATIVETRLGLLLFGLAFYFAAYPVLQFGERHYFHLEFMAWWALGFLVHGAAEAAWKSRRPEGRAALAASLRQHPWPSRLALGIAVWFVVVGLMGGTLLAAREYQTSHLQALFASYLSEPLDRLDLNHKAIPHAADDGGSIVRFDSPSRVGRSQSVGDGNAVHSEYIVVDFGGGCDAFKFDVVFQYAAADPIDDFSRTIQVRPPVEADSVQRIFFPAYFYLPKHADSRRGSYGLAGIDVPSAAAGCVSSLGRMRDTHNVPLLLDLNLPPRWESATLYHTIAGWERRRNGDEQPDIYTFPPDLPVRRNTLTAGITPISEFEIEQRSPTLKVHDDQWIVDGTGGVGGQGPFLYLAQMRPRYKKQGSLLLARGRIDDGGISLGLVRDGRWIAQVPVTTAGEFVVVVRVPADGTYAPVLANNLIGRSLDNHVQLKRFGWLANP